MRMAEEEVDGFIWWLWGHGQGGFFVYRVIFF